MVEAKMRNARHGTFLLVGLFLLPLFAMVLVAPAGAQTPTLAIATSQAASVGARVTLLGSNLGPGTRVVNVGGISATVLPMLNSMQANAIDILIPSGVASGATTITASVNGVSAGAIPFDVLAGAPNITSAPDTVSPGDTVTISGDNLPQTVNGGPNYVLAGDFVVPVTASASGWSFQVPSFLQTTVSFTAVVDGVFSAPFTPLLKIPTTTKVLLSPSTVQQGQTFNLTVNVTTGVSTTVNGLATCTANGVAFGGSITIQAGTSGPLSEPTTGFGVGNEAIVCVYQGSTTLAASTSPAATLKVTSSAAAPTVTLASSENPSVYGDMVTFSVTVSAPPGNSNIPTGTVSLQDAGNTVVSVPLTSGSSALIPLASLAVGNHPLTAVYLGDGNFASASSPIVNQNVTSTQAACPSKQ